MAGTSFKDYLKNSIPEFQQGDNDYTKFLDVVGSFLDEIKEAVEHFDYNRDFNKGTVYNLENSIFSRGVNLPRNIATEEKRKYLRDISEIIIKTGTDDGLKHSLKMIGFDANIKRAWIQNPEELQSGRIKDILTGQVRNANIGRYFFIDFVYGEEYVTNEGTFFRGNTYFDMNNETNQIEGIPILGQSYDSVPTSFDTVGATPYVVVQIDQGAFNIDVSEYYSEETGKYYQYTTNEEFELINELIRYFISSGQRPTTVRFIIIISAQSINDTIDIFDTFADETTYTPDGGDDLVDNLELPDATSVDGTVTVDMSIGKNALVGLQYPHKTQLSIINNIPYGDTDLTKPEIKSWNAYTTNIKVYMDYFYPYIPVRPLTDITFTNNTPHTINVYTSVDDVNGIKQDSLIDIILPTESFTYLTTPDDQYIKFVQDTIGSKTDFIEIASVYSAFSQE